jgi:tRNA 5-methylaminomethyl-2-thiouridine biosynthesis bifunctional protein
LPLDARIAAAPACTVLDTDFGGGGRFLAVWRQWRNTPGHGRMLHYVGLLPADKPITPQPGDTQAQELALALSHMDGHEGFHRLLLDDGQVSLTLCLGDARTALAQQSMQADIVYFNALSPAAPPLSAVAKCCKRGTRLQLTNALATPGADAIHALKTLGFRPGVTDAWVFDPTWPVQRSRQAPRAAWAQPQCCTVIGAGISGAAVARVLVLRGWQVQVLDALAGPAAGASGLPAGLVSPVRSADDGPVSQLTRSGCALTRKHAQALLAQAPSGGRRPRRTPSAMAA